MIKNKKIYIVIIIIILSMICLVGCSLNKEEDRTIEDKTDEEINYVEERIFTLVNRYAKEEYIVDDTLDWKSIKDDTQNLNNSIDTIILDLSEVNISNEDLIKFKDELNNLNIAISNEDEHEFLQRCNYLYSLLPSFLEKYSQNKNKINIMKLKSLVLTSYIQSNFFDWARAKETVALADNKYKEMMDDIDYMKEYDYNLNKIYVLLEEFKNVIDAEEADLARIKYINFIDKI